MHIKITSKITTKFFYILFILIAFSNTNIGLFTIKNYTFNLSLYLSIAYTNVLRLNLSVLPQHRA